MKQGFIITIAVLLLFQTANAQEVKNKDTVISYSEIKITSTNSSDFIVQVGGHDFTFGKRGNNSFPNCRDIVNRRKNYISFCNNIRLGFNALVDTDYSKYAPEYNDFLDLKGGKSIHFGMDIAGMYLQLDRRGDIYLGVGVSVQCDNYTFSNNITIKRIDGVIMPEELDKEYKKSKLTATYFGIPVYLTFRPYNKIKIALNGYAEFLTNSHTKYKKPKHKSDISGLNPVQLGLGGSFTYSGFGVYVKYSLTPLFKSESGPGAHLLSAGLVIGF
jgi:hypothetical protein